MCRHAVLNLPPLTAAAPQARAFIRKCCAQWALGAMCADLSILVTELVTNALLHADGASTVTVSVAEAVLEMSVVDGSRVEPVMRPQRTDLSADLAVLGDDHSHPDELRHRDWAVGDAGPVTAGRGLLIIDALADRWGVQLQPAGKAVWLTLDTPQSPRRHDCACIASPTHRTASGRPVARMTPPGSGD